MEKSNDQNCSFMPHFCSAGLEAPKPVVKPEIKMIQKNTVNASTEGQKPWSIFGDVYWI